MLFDDRTKLFDAQVGVIRVGAGGEIRAVELQDETGRDDGLVFPAHDISHRLHVSFFAGIVFVTEKTGETTGR